MSACQSTSSSRTCGLIAKIAGIVLMLSGALVLLFCVPCWFWTMLLGLALLAGGFLIYRFRG